MGKNAMPRICYLVMLSVCIDQGDGRWKERGKENLQHDILVYKKIAEKLERDVEAFYDEYPNEWLKGDNVDRIHYKYLANILNHNTEITKNIENKGEEKHTFPFVSSGTDVTETTEPTTTDKSKRLVQNDSDKYKSTDWPTFQDILLAIGRKYDWKNDRWIKVKEKPKKIKTNLSQANEVNVSEKHKFSYRIVKLNKSKSRRNVVVAVSAVR